MNDEIKKDVTWQDAKNLIDEIAGILDLTPKEVEMLETKTFDFKGYKQEWKIEDVQAYYEIQILQLQESLKTSKSLNETLEQTIKDLNLTIDMIRRENKELRARK